MLIEIHNKRVDVPAGLQDWLRLHKPDSFIKINPLFDNSLGLYITDQQIGPHTDDLSPPGFCTYLTILVNDGRHVMRLAGHDGPIDLEPGTVLRFDQRQRHSTRLRNIIEAASYKSWRLVFVAWDMPQDHYTLEMFHQDLVQRLDPNVPINTLLENLRP